MQEFLDGLGRWFSAFGVHPVIGGAIVGLLAAVVLRRMRSGELGPGISIGTSIGGLAPDGQRGALERWSTSVGVSSATVTTGDKTVEVPPEKLAEIARLARERRTIDAIKLVRAATGLELVDAKRLVEAMARSAVVP